MMMRNDMTIELFEPANASVEAWERFNALLNRLALEESPDDPPITTDVRRQGWLSFPTFVHRTAWTVAASSGEYAAYAFADYYGPEVADNQHILQAQIGVRAEYRQQGLGRALLANIADLAREQNKRLLLFMTTAAVPDGEAFMERLGAHKGLEVTENQLALDDLDRDLVDKWLARGRERADVYDLVFVSGPYPEEILPQMVVVREAMNQAPVDDLDVEDFVWTDEVLRQLDATLVARGHERWTYYVQERATGNIAGYTEMTWTRSKPAIGHQGDTAVLQQYRNHGLGRWLKAAMLKKVLEEKPDATHVRTGNANSNGPMLKINYELGFKPYKSQAVWQVSREAVEGYLEPALTIA